MQLDNMVYFKSSENMPELASETADLIVTSPPYPMIEMWDGIFSGLPGGVFESLESGDACSAYEQMHLILDRVWAECFRILKRGGFACINIGDATRKLGDSFRLYPNHARITSAMVDLGFDCLPMIHWFKPTNSPNKFMGSGMLPSGAYVTLEHEYILIFRKGGKREFPEHEKPRRRRSAFFWEERNRWFSDVWDFRGEKQLLETDAAGRRRSGAFPIELPYRLINMYSLQGDTVVDPFLGTGTTMAAAVICGRRCIGYETDRGLKDSVVAKCRTAAECGDGLTRERLRNHIAFISEYSERKGPPRYVNETYGCGVITSQEREIILPRPNGELIKTDNGDRLSLSCGYGAEAPVV